MRPLREREGDEKEDGCVLYLDFHGLLRRLLPTLIPRLQASSKSGSKVNSILSVMRSFMHRSSEALQLKQGRVWCADLVGVRKLCNLCNNSWGLTGLLH